MEKLNLFIYNWNNFYFQNLEFLRQFKNFLNAFNNSYKPSALWDNRTASSAKARKNIYIVATSNKYRFLCAILCYFMYYNKYGYTWSKKIQNNFGDAPSPYFTPLLMSKLSYYCPLIDTIPLLLTYIFLISFIKHYGIFNWPAISSHSALRSTRS